MSIAEIAMRNASLGGFHRVKLCDTLGLVGPRNEDARCAQAGEIGLLYKLQRESIVLRIQNGLHLHPLIIRPDECVLE